MSRQNIHNFKKEEGTGRQNAVAIQFDYQSTRGTQSCVQQERQYFIVNFNTEEDSDEAISRQFVEEMLGRVKKELGESTEDSSPISSGPPPVSINSPKK